MGAVGALGRELCVGTVVEERRYDGMIDEASMMVGLQLLVVKSKKSNVWMGDDD